MDLYSKRKKAAENPPKTHRFDLPQEFRNQVWFILRDALGYVQRTPDHMHRFSFDPPRSELICQIYAAINKELCEEHGILGLTGTSPCDELGQWFLEQAETDTALDIIEVSFRSISKLQHNRDFIDVVRPALNTKAAIAKLNRRFQEHAIGYRYEGGQIICVDSEFLNTEVTEPALQLLFDQKYEGALEEFQLAHKHYRQGSEYYDDCLTNCLKSLESVLKTICDRRHWTYSNGASKLIEIAFSKGLIPDYLQSHFAGLRTALESGVPTIRNREGGHGSGELPNDVPKHLVAYQLHLTASAIVLLVQANDAYRKS